MLTRLTKDGHWLHTLMQKDLNFMIRLRFRAEMEKRYSQEIQKLCQISSFEMASRSKDNVDQEPLEMMVIIAKKRLHY